LGDFCIGFITRVAARIAAIVIVVRGPKHVVKKGKTPVLTAEEARELLDSIPVLRNTVREGKPESLEPLLVGCATTRSSR
jgi:hypothetical protein